MSLQQIRYLFGALECIDRDGLCNLADVTYELGINTLDVRYMVMSECLRVSAAFWEDGDSGAVSSQFMAALQKLWDAYLSGIISADTEEAGTQIAVALLEEISLLSNFFPCG